MKILKPLIAVLFILYGLVMLWLLFGQRIEDFECAENYLEQLKFEPFPFQTVMRFGRIILTGDPVHLVPHAWQNLVGNVVMFVPLGFCLPFFSARCRTVRSVLLVGLLIVTCVELTQFFTLLGSLDFDDFMLNLIGIALGFGIWKSVDIHFLSQKKT